MVKAKKASGLVLFAVFSLGVLPVFASYAFAAAQSPVPKASNSVMINEFMADNQATIRNPSGNFSDWIELYNPADFEVDISGFFLTDNLTDYRWQIPANITIAAHGYLLLWADGDIRQGPLHTNFQLSANGEAIALFDADGARLDWVAYGEQLTDVSYGRPVDGEGGWVYLAHPSPGSANADDESNLMYPWHVWAVVACVALGLCAVLLIKGGMGVCRKP